MDILILLLILLGALIMVYNITCYSLFLRDTRDVLLSGGNNVGLWRKLALCLLIFFLLGYLFIAIFTDPNLLVALILFFGSVFVSIVLILMFRLLETVKLRSLDIAKALIGVIDARDPNLNGHSLHVQSLTMLIYKYLPRQLKSQINSVSLEYASLLHDVGKLGIPEAILNKPEKLTDEEWEVMRTHPSIGVRFLQPIKAFEDIDDWIRYHHERVDGQGYYKLDGKDIPLASRIISVADTYSAVTLRRSYKPAKTYEDAVAILRDAAGTQLDSTIVDIFLAIPKEEVDACMPEKMREHGDAAEEPRGTAETNA